MTKAGTLRKAYFAAISFPSSLSIVNLTNSNLNIEVNATNTTANAWEELTFNFPGIVNANNYQRVVVFFNFGNSGNGASYYFDDIRLSN